MAQGERAPDGRTYWGWRPDEMASFAAAHAAEHGFQLELRSDTPVIVDEHFAGRGLTSGTWGEIDTLLRDWAEIGCAWVNLRFALDESQAMVRVQANPSDEPLPDGGLPACNGGFDCRRLMSSEAFFRLHPDPPAEPTA